MANKVKDQELLCPLPDVRHVQSDRIRQAMERLYLSQGITDSRFAEFDEVVSELSGAIPDKIYSG